MAGAGLTVCLLGAAVLPPLLTPTAPARLEAVAAPVASPTPLPSLTPAAELAITRTTDTIWASQSGDSLPITYTTPRVMQAGTVYVQLTGVRIREDEASQGRQVVRFELVDALTRDVLGAADTTRVDGVDGDAAVLATLTAPHATYLRVSAEVRGESTCDGCEAGGYTYEAPIWHTWKALLQYDKAG
ncbi:hypothetical protein [Microbacterium sp. GXF6406]